PLTRELSSGGWISTITFLPPRPSALSAPPRSVSSPLLQPLHEHVPERDQHLVRHVLRSVVLQADEPARGALRERLAALRRERVRVDVVEHVPVERDGEARAAVEDLVRVPLAERRERVLERRH